MKQDGGRTANLANLVAMLARLSRNRGQGVDSLIRAAGMDQSELAAVFEGDDFGQSVLRRLAPALGVHTADLFVLAGLEVPNDLVPRTDPADSVLDHLVRAALRLPSERREQLLGVARSMPQPSTVASVVWKHDAFPYAPGSVIVRMLRNRNLNNLNSVKMLYRLAGIGPLSAATIQAVGSGRKELTPELLCGFAAVLSFRADDLAALIDIELTHPGPSTDTATQQVAELIWDVRHLSSEQLRAIQEEAERGHR
ncbi:hypothetical protein [Micromonospora radicis]|uniref:hypothetical protein n=1 Tax=Micromonospora radicis TaxID=1894971 RepID=UPI0011C3CB40|nr:hypothetical protein [Micromonospora radicis]